MNIQNLTIRHKRFFQVLAFTSVLFLNQASAKTCAVSSHVGEIESVVAYKQVISKDGCKQGDILWIEILGEKTEDRDYHLKVRLLLYRLRANVCSLNKHVYLNTMTGWAGLLCVYREAS